jgi:2-polyprenyl-3-methyl-5-hydroxy-6-metoxy-1,4-benzoquinol methylase
LQPVEYYSGLRDDVHALLPSKISRCLEVGCGIGNTSAWLKKEFGCRTSGIELNAEIAAKASEVMDEVIVGDVESLEIGERRFDCILCLDVLEHLLDPAATVRKLAKSLSPGGTFITSLPNVQHFSISLNLLRGKWEYADAGLLDRTHRVFFVKKTAIELLEQNGLRVTRIESNIGPVPRFLNALTLKAFHGFFSYQYLLQAVARSD